VWDLGLLHEFVDEQDYNDSAQNDHPIGKLNASYRCLFAKPVHDYPPILKQRLTKGETRRKVRGRGLYMSKFFFRRWPHPPVCRPYLNSALALFDTFAEDHFGSDRRQSGRASDIVNR
jgi:hypothetical protein